MPRHCLPVSIVWRSRYRLNAVSTCAGWACREEKAEGKARQAVDEFHCRSADAPVTGFHTRKNQLVVLRGLSLQQKGQKLAPLRIVQRVQVLEIQRVFRIAKRRAVVSQQIIPGFTAQQVTVDLNKRVAATRAAQVDCARQIFLPCSGGAEQKHRCASCRRLQDALMILGGEAGDVIDTGGARLLQLAAVIVADAVFVPGDRGCGSEKIKGGIGLSVGGKLHRFNVVQQPAELLHDLDASRRRPRSRFSGAACPAALRRRPPAWKKPACPHG